MKIITLEDHFATPMMMAKRPPIPQAGMDGIAARGRQLGHDIEVELLDLTGSRVKAMDEAGIDLQVVSLTMPGTEAFGPDIAIPMAQDANDRLAAAVKERPGRLKGFAALPTSDPAAAAKELERAVKQLGFVGAMINGHTQGNYLDDRKYWAISSRRPRRWACRSISTRASRIPRCMKTYFTGFEDLGAARLGLRQLETCNSISCG